MATRKRTTARRSADTEALNTSAGEGEQSAMSGSADKGAQSGPGEGAQPHSMSKGVDDIRVQLAEHVGSLRFVTGALGVCVQALQQQAADMDVEIASVLQRVVGDGLDEATDRIKEIALGIELEEA